jgi:uncharacterized protein
MFSYSPPMIILSPCIGICELDAAGYCAGCHRNASEIAGWSAFSDSERLRIMNYVLPARESAQGR